MSSYSKTQSHAFLWFLIFSLIGAFVFINVPFLFPMILASIFALGLHDHVEKITKRFRSHRVLTINLVLLGGLGVFFIPLFLAAYRAVGYLSRPQELERDRIVEQIQVLKNFAINNIQRISNFTGVDIATPAKEIVESGLQKLGTTALQFSSDFVTHLPAFVIASFTFFVLLLVMLLKSSGIRRFIIDYSPLSQKTTEQLIVIAKDSCSITLFSTFVVGVIQAFIVGFGSLIFGEGDFWLVLAVTFVVSFIPVIGAAPVGYVLALLAFLGDRTGAAIGLAIVATFSGTIDNILKPLLVGKDNNISAVIGFTCVVGAVIMLGLPGLLLGPVILNLVSRALPILLKDNLEKN